MNYSEIARLLASAAKPSPSPPVEGGPPIGLPPVGPTYNRPPMMLGPEWLGLDVPLPEILSPLGSALVERVIGQGGIGEFLPGIGDAMDASAALGYGADAVGAAIDGRWSDMGRLGSMAAISAMGALPGADAPNVRHWVYDKADDLAGQIRARGLTAEVKPWRGEVGNSAYVTATAPSPWGDVPLRGDARISDHDVGPTRYSQHWGHVQDAGDDLTRPLSVVDDLLARVSSRDSMYENIVTALRNTPELGGAIRDMLAAQRPQLDRITALLRRAGLPVPEGGVSRSAVPELLRRLGE